MNDEVEVEEEAPYEAIEMCRYNPHAGKWTAELFKQSAAIALLDKLIKEGFVSVTDREEGYERYIRYSFSGRKA